MRVGIVITSGCFASGVVGMLDVLRAAESLREDVDASIPPVRVELLADARDVAVGPDLTLRAARSTTETDDLDVVVLAALGTLDEATTLAALRSPTARSLVRVVEEIADGDTALAAACTGTFLLAEAGVLSGGRATTSWWLGTTFAERYPRVRLDLASMVVTDERATTAGAAFAHIDLGLALVRHASPALAEQVASRLVLDQRPSQSAYAVLDHLAHADPIVADYERYVRTHLHEPLDVTRVARAIGTSPRTLERRMR